MASVEPHDLVLAVRRELEDADAVGSWAGQLALELARRLAVPDAPGPVALADRLEAAMAAAVPVRPLLGPELPDEVTRARAAREAARQAAQRGGDS